MDFDTPDPSTMYYEFLAVTVSDDKYREVLDALAHAIQAASRRAEEAAESSRAGGDGGWGEVVVDDQCDLIENLLGAAYIVCQTQITAITSVALSARSHALTIDPEVAVFGGHKVSVRALGDPLPHNPTVVGVEALWSLANYFKHREEWPHGSDWSKLEGQSKGTADCIAKLGLKPGSTGNLRTGAEALGNSSFDDLQAFAGIVDTWGAKVLQEVRRLLKA